MGRLNKKRKAVSDKVDVLKRYELKEALTLMKETPSKRFFSR